ncbi:terminal nucleotidyltransferase 4A-like [Eriocheir sinensis]|uniref:terminal nucleotidyltransferase 4A-like n=1 Tax=Eriocheir sinensis TaxID=95602 RepID=UPI0021C814B7|nr:terminal nucleotidyltransferase 4A-like [Eriocheir sinensis]
MWPQVRVEATGSLANGLYMADSDVDATLLGHWPDGRAWRLGQLTVLEKTTVPLVKFVHQATGLPVDVSQGSEAAVRAAELVRELLRRFPALAPISLLVRHYLRGLGLAEVFTGGVSSYAVTLMVTSFLQLQIPPDAQHDLGWLLVSFFAFYGYEFNFASTGISVVGRGRYLRKEDVPIVMPRGHRRADLCIQDPLCPTNDLGGPPSVSGTIQSPVAEKESESKSKLMDIKESLKGTYFFLQADYYVLPKDTQWCLPPTTFRLFFLGAAYFPTVVSVTCKRVGYDIDQAPKPTVKNNRLNLAKTPVDMAKRQPPADGLGQGLVGDECLPL